MNKKTKTQQKLNDLTRQWMKKNKVSQMDISARLGKHEKYVTGLLNASAFAYKPYELMAEFIPYPDDLMRQLLVEKNQFNAKAAKLKRECLKGRPIVDRQTGGSYPWTLTVAAMKDNPHISAGPWG